MLYLCILEFELHAREVLFRDQLVGRSGMQEEREIEQLPPDARRKARQMVEIEKDVLLQWIALIFLTLKDLDCEWVSLPIPALN